MFYDNFLKLCNQRGISPTAAVVEMGFQKSVVTRWKKSIPTDANKLKIAQYFGITVDDLMCEQKEKPTVSNDDELIEGLPITRVARNGKKMPVDQQEKLLELAKFMFPEYFNDDDAKV